jgi:hypothetical protein
MHRETRIVDAGFTGSRLALRGHQHVQECRRACEVPGIDGRLDGAPEGLVRIERFRFWRSARAGRGRIAGRIVASVFSGSRPFSSVPI